VPVPNIRIRDANGAPVRADGGFVLYWMTAQRRTNWNHALDRALEWCAELGKPLLVFEPLRCGHRWAAVRHHAFVLQGMADNAEACAAANVRYFPYVEPQAGAGKGLLQAFAARACVVVADDWPGFFLPRMLRAAARKLTVRLEPVEGCGLLPLRATDKVFSRAVDFRRHLQKHLRPHLGEFPAAAPLSKPAPTLARVPQGLN